MGRHERTASIIYIPGVWLQWLKFTIKAARGLGSLPLGCTQLRCLRTVSGLRRLASRLLGSPRSLHLSAWLCVVLSVRVLSCYSEFCGGVTRAHSMEQRFRLRETSAPQIGPAMMCAKPHWRLCRRKRLRGKSTKRNSFSISRFDHLKTLHGTAATRTKS